MAIRLMGIYLTLCAELFIQDNLTNFFFYFPKIQAVGPLLCHNDHIITLGKMGLMQSKEFPNEPLYLVSLYRVACLLAYGYTQPRDTQPVRLNNERKVLRMVSLARLI